VRRVCPFLPRPPTELADGFGREGARRRRPGRAVGRFTPMVRWVPGPAPARSSGWWFGGVRSFVA
jgi:hypothetical protein